MLFLVLGAIASGGAALAIWTNKKQIVENLQIIGYELLYWGLGALAIGDDLVWGWNNQLKELPKRTGDVAIVTGGARGIGVEVVRKLLQCDMTVVVACRNVSAGEAAVHGLRSAGVTAGVADVLPLDTASQAAVKKFAETFCAKYAKLHLLINNAGIMFAPYSLTEDGFESQLAVNYLGHFTLTHLLMPILARTGQDSGRFSRVVNVSSCAHLPGSINFEDMHYQNSLYIPSQAYAQSKLAQVMFTKAAARRLADKNIKVSLYALHPGVVNTELFDGTALKRLLPFMPALFFKRPDQGAITTLHCALSPNLEGKTGLYLANCRETFVSREANNAELQERLMQYTQKLLNIPDFVDLATL